MGTASVGHRVIPMASWVVLQAMMLAVKKTKGLSVCIPYGMISLGGKNLHDFSIKEAASIFCSQTRVIFALSMIVKKKYQVQIFSTQQ